MTAGSPDADPARAPFLVLGLGNLLLHDDGAGLELLASLQRAGPWPLAVEFVDGGTQGLALLGLIADRRLLLILDAVALGAAPGSVHVLDGETLAAWRVSRPGTAHQGNALSLLEAARLLESEPASIAVVGLEPEVLDTGIGLSASVAARLPDAVARAASLLRAALPANGTGARR